MGAEAHSSQACTSKNKKSTPMAPVNEVEKQIHAVVTCLTLGRWMASRARLTVSAGSLHAAYLPSHRAPPSI